MGDRGGTRSVTKCHKVSSWGHPGVILEERSGKVRKGHERSEKVRTSQGRSEKVMEGLILTLDV